MRLGLPRPQSSTTAAWAWGSPVRWSPSTHWAAQTGPAAAPKGGLPQAGGRGPGTVQMPQQAPARAQPAAWGASARRPPPAVTPRTACRAAALSPTPPRMRARHWQRQWSRRCSRTHRMGRCGRTCGQQRSGRQLPCWGWGARHRALGSPPGAPGAAQGQRSRPPWRARLPQAHAPARRSTLHDPPWTPTGRRAWPCRTAQARMRPTALQEQRGRWPGRCQYPCNLAGAWS